MKRTAALCALAFMGLAGLAGSALADKGGQPSPPPGHSGNPPGQEKKAEPAQPATPAQPAATNQGQSGAKPPKPAKPAKPAEPAKSAKPAAAPATPSTHPRAGKITICHRTGSEKNPWVQITVSANAWEAHRKHGDLNPVPAGGCPRGGPPGRPSDGGGGDRDHKITICHRTGSEKNPWVEITISENAWPAHREHGDLNPVPAGGCPAGPTGRPPTTTMPSGGITTTTTTTTTVATTPPVAAAAPGGPTVTTQGAPVTTTAVAGPSSPVQPAAPPGEARKGAPAGAEPKAGPERRVSAEQEPEEGVLERARDLGREVRQENLPFTGLPLWIAVLAGVGLTGTGLGIRKWARPAGHL